MGTRLKRFWRGSGRHHESKWCIDEGLRARGLLGASTEAVGADGCHFKGL